MVFYFSFLSPLILIKRAKRAIIYLTLSNEAIKNSLMLIYDYK
tara:strand:- start:507 stop:635 length:129 start_codon:yes stop_codon:yes gene_type:complete